MAVSGIGLAKSFGQVEAVAGINLTVAAGEVHGLVGPNGAGKSTVMAMLLGLVEPDVGELTLLGRDRARVERGWLDGVAGFIGTPAFYPYLSGRRNLEHLVRLDGSQAFDRIDSALTTAGIGDAAGRKVRGYSLGMRQRLALAAALVRAPEVLILDEPANGLDPAAARELRILIRGLAAAGTTVLLSSHDMAAMDEMCDAITVLRSGRTVFEGSVEEMRTVAPAASHLLSTSDDQAAGRRATGVPGVRVKMVPGGLEVVAGQPELDHLVIGLGAADIAVRSLRLKTTALESLFFRLTESGDSLGPVKSAIDPADRTGVHTIAPLPARGPVRSTVAVWSGELLKLAAHGWTRVALGLCLLGPFLAVVALHAQSSVPQDTLFGRWVHESGFALPLVILTFSGQWVLPALAALVAGNVFAAEDHHGTWKTLLTRSCTRSQIFVGKILAAVSWSVVVVAVLGASSVSAGLLMGRQPLVDLSGVPQPAGRALALVALSWVSALPPTLGFTAVAACLSVLFRRSIVGIGGPVLLGLLMALLGLVDGPALARLLMLSTGFDAWHGLWVDPEFTGPLAVSSAVSAIWFVIPIAVAYVVFLRRPVSVN